MIVHKNYKQGLVTGETDKSYRVLPYADKTVWWPKAQCAVWTDFYSLQVAMHLCSGYRSQEEFDNYHDSISYISRFVPVLLVADSKLDRQIRDGRDDWDKVFLYDVARPAGAWLANNPKANIDTFTAHVEELIK